MTFSLSPCRDLSPDPRHRGVDGSTLSLSFHPLCGTVTPGCSGSTSVLLRRSRRRTLGRGTVHSTDGPWVREDLSPTREECPSQSKGTTTPTSGLPVTQMKRCTNGVRVHLGRLQSSPVGRKVCEGRSTENRTKSFVAGTGKRRTI